MPYRIPLSRPAHLASSRAYLERALAGQQSAGGPFGKTCEAWLGAHFSQPALLTGSCSAALEMAVILAGIQAGDDVIMPSFTFPSTANAVVRQGATPVFVDVCPDTLNLNIDLIEAAINASTRAIIVVHYAGVGCDMPRLQALCKQRKLTLIEDNAQGLMATYQGKSLGSFGDYATISFHSTKNIGCGEGGALLLNDTTQRDRAFQLRDKGTNRQAFIRGDVSHYQWVAAGSHYGLSDVQAALLLAQLEAATDITHARLRGWQFYHHALQRAELAGKLRRPIIPAACQHNAHCYYVLLDNRQQRDQVQHNLQACGINACSHYEPLHSAPAGKQFGRSQGELPVTESVAGRILRLPLWDAIEPTQQEEVVERLLEALAVSDN